MLLRGAQAAQAAEASERAFRAYAGRVRAGHVPTCSAGASDATVMLLLLSYRCHGYQSQAGSDEG